MYFKAENTLMMDYKFQEISDSLFCSTNNLSTCVKGITCTNNQGLCLGVKGKAHKESSGIISNIACKIENLEPNNNEMPIVILESNDLNCFIKKENEDCILAFFKSA